MNADMTEILKELWVPENSYAAAVGCVVVPWRTFLDKERYTDPELEKAVELGSDWKTCAVGIQDSDILRRKDGRPLDPELARRGERFSFYLKLMAHYLMKGEKQRGMGVRRYVRLHLKKIEERVEALKTHTP
jgi:hypothetical protein